MNRQSRISGADGVRAIACLMVMLHHAFQRLSPQELVPNVVELQKFFWNGQVGVAVFFVLSGFLLSEPFWRAWSDGRAQPSLKTFAIRRWARIAPAFWLNLVIVFALSLWLVPDVPDRILRFLAGLSFTSSLTWQTFFPVDINLPLWSIGYEVFSYAALGVGALIWFRLPVRRSILVGIAYWILVLAVVLVVHQLLLWFTIPDEDGKGWMFGPYGGAKAWWPDYNPVGFFAIFLIGILSAGLSTGLGRLLVSRWFAPWRWPFDLAVLVALYLGFRILWETRALDDFGFSFPTMPYYFPAFPLMVGAVLVFAPHSGFVGKWLDNRTFSFIATISFGLYIWHYALLEIARIWLWPDDFGTYGVADATDWLFRIVGVYFVAFVLATLSWYFFERPIVTWSRRFGARRAASAVDADAPASPGALEPQPALLAD